MKLKFQMPEAEQNHQQPRQIITSPTTSSNCQDIRNEHQSNAQFLAYRERLLRKGIIYIQGQRHLTSTQKSQNIQRLMGSNDWIPTFDSAQDLSSIITQVACQNEYEQEELEDDEIDLSASNTCPKANTVDKIRTFHCKEQLGCPHYARKCKIYAECCQKWYACRVCHDKAVENEHLLKAENVYWMLCMVCGTEQRISQNCSQCHASMGNYWCGICRLWEDASAEEKPIFHCSECGICRQGFQEDFTHCNKCNCCLAKSYASSHKCIERNLECDCPICGDYLFTSMSPITFMQCGHAIHVSCFTKMELKATHTCPVCQKSVRDMKFLFERWDQIMAAQQMPEEYTNDRSLILCNDCEKRSETKYHFYYHKCSECNSYNTKVIEVIKAAATVNSSNESRNAAGLSFGPLVYSATREEDLLDSEIDELLEPTSPK